ncbi:MAG: formylglycine-generating enzyme family protein [Thermomicrobiales bacterium]|nr:formylglycine-generating enzyme family protein [Thermomicrobiales bacterium]
MGSHPPTSIPDGMIWIPGGDFLMGSDHHYQEERPQRSVYVDGFWMDTHLVTNRDFSGFVAATGYITLAEKAPDPAMYPGAPAENLVPGSMVFVPTPGPVDLRYNAQWWRWMPGADWRHPGGPTTSIEGLDDHPVVHVCWEDVEAYARWLGKELPTEAEWERAARGNFAGAEFTWGAEDTQETDPLAQTWFGQFPWRNDRAPGQQRTSPVGSYSANDFDLYDMAGNVWEWTSDWYADHRNPVANMQSCCTARNPRGASMETSKDRSTSIPQKVVKGGSHLCARHACFRYRPAARQPQMIDTGMSHVGFRCIKRP